MIPDNFTQKKEKKNRTSISFTMFLRLKKVGHVLYTLGGLEHS